MGSLEFIILKILNLWFLIKREILINYFHIQEKLKKCKFVNFNFLQNKQNHNDYHKDMLKTGIRSSRICKDCLCAMIALLVDIIRLIIVVCPLMSDHHNEFLIHL